jgi:RNA polymerase sigma-70 factor (ECF subfamily)
MNVEGIVSWEEDVSSSTASEQSFNEDLCLINRIKANDSTAFDALVKKYRERLFSVVHNMTSNRDDAFDITQEVFIKAFRGIKNFNGKSVFLPGCIELP